MKIAFLLFALLATTSAVTGAASTDATFRRNRGSTPRFVPLTFRQHRRGRVITSSQAETSTLEQQLSIRGGGDGDDVGILGLDPKLTAKTLAMAYIAQGAAFNLAPRLLNKVYGWEQDSEMAEFITQNLGSALLGTGVACYCLFFRETTLLTAIGGLSLVWTINYLQWLLFKTHEKAGAAFIPFVVVAAVSTVAAYTGLANTGWAENYYKFWSTLFALSALSDAFFPASGMKILFTRQGSSIGDDPKQLNFMYRTFNYFLLAMEVHILLLLWGVDSVKAIGYASLAGVAYFLSSLFITKEIGQVSKKPMPYVLGLVYFVLHIVNILVKGGEGSKPAKSTTGGDGGKPAPL